jgi:hypothetical protein
MVTILKFELTAENPSAIVLFASNDDKLPFKESIATKIFNCLLPLFLYKKYL